MQTAEDHKKLSSCYRNKPERVFGLQVQCRGLDTFKILGIFWKLVWNFFRFLGGFFVNFLGFFWDFFGNFLWGFFLRIFFGWILGEIFCEDIFKENFFWRNFLGGIFLGDNFWEKCFGRIFLGGIVQADGLGISETNPKSINFTKNKNILTFLSRKIQHIFCLINSRNKDLQAWEYWRKIEKIEYLFWPMFSARKGCHWTKIW